MRKYHLIFLFVLLSYTVSTYAQNDTSHLRISVLTCAPGNELYSTFGHTAIRIVDSMQQTDWVYNYGTFDFSDPDFYSKFTRGKLDYFLSVAPFDNFMYEYQIDKRAVTEQVLVLPKENLSAIQQALTQNLAGANRYYKYDFLYDNCTSRVRDILQKNASLTVNTLLVPPQTSFRNMLHEYLDKGGQAWSKLGIDLLLGSPIDKKVNIDQSMFLPDYLMKGIDSAKQKKDGAPFASSASINNGIPLLSGNKYQPLLIFSFICLVLLVTGMLKNKWFVTFTKISDFLLFFITGLIGILLVFMWVGTDHKSCAGNFNLLWAIPFHVIAAFSIWKKPKWAQVYFTASTVIYSALLISWFWLPQELNNAFAPLTILLLNRSMMLRRQ